MKRIIGLLIATFMLCAAAVHAQSPSPDAANTIDQLSQSAEDRLESSVRELNQLREQIAAEKLPLAQELTTLEETLGELRRRHDVVVRQIDEGTLELATIKTEMKARQDELTYISTLLDEYARTFESKINVSEMQYCGEAIENAKQASENNALSLDNKFARQTGFVTLTLERLFNVIGGMRFPGVGVDLQGVVTQGEFAIVGPVSLFRSATGSAIGLAIPQTGSMNPLIRPLEGKLQTGLANVVQNGNGLLPLDPSRGAALKALVQRTNLIHIFEKGGPIMWPLLVASFIALITVIERCLFLMIVRLRRNPKALDRFFTLVGQGNRAEAIRVGESSKFFVVRALAYALAHRETSLASALLYAQAKELKRFQRGISVLDTVITLAPLLGLLGTVTGMMGSFSIIGGELSSPGAITGGIAEALIATAFGLGIAITALLPFNFLNAKTEQARHEIEAAGTQLELMVGTGTPSAAAPSSPVPPPSKAQDQNRVTAETNELQRQTLAIQRQIDELQAALAQRNHLAGAMTQPPAMKEA